jgi:rare lipoprotein A
MRAYQVKGIWYYPKKERLDSRIRGIASWYGEKYHGRKTANGEVYNMYSMTAAHKTLPMNTMLLVKNLETEKEVTVRVNDRGPFIGDRVLDLSKRAAERIGMLKNGTSLVEIRVLGYDGKIEIDLNSERASKSIEEPEDIHTNNREKENHKVVIKPIVHNKVEKKIDKQESQTVVVQPIEIATIEESSSPLDIEIIDKKPVNVEDVAKPIHIIESSAIRKPQIEESSNIKSSKTHLIVEKKTDDHIPTFVLEQKEETTSSEEPKEESVVIDEVSSFEESENREPIETQNANDYREAIPVVENREQGSLKTKDRKHYYVQVASFRDRSGAKFYIDRYSVVLDDPQKLITVEAKGLFKVWVAGFSSKDEAKEFVSSGEKFPSSFLIIKEESVE